METTAQTLARNLKDLRKGRFTQVALAAASGVARSTIANIEGGTYDGANTTVLDSLAEALGVHVSALLSLDAHVQTAVHGSFQPRSSSGRPRLTGRPRRSGGAQRQTHTR
jgi:transcriptional regulator with XRE-family HTH domain